MKLARETVGTTDNNLALRDISGAGLLPLQVEPHANFVGTFRVLARAASDAPWREIKASGSTGFIEAVSYVPFVRLEILTKTGGSATEGVSLWVHEG